MKYDLGWTPVFAAQWDGDYLEEYEWEEAFVADSYGSKEGALAFIAKDHQPQYWTVRHLSMIDGKVVDDTEEFSE